VRILTEAANLNRIDLLLEAGRASNQMLDVYSRSSVNEVRRLFPGACLFGNNSGANVFDNIMVAI
jgi:hypothetical protein